MNLSYFYVNLNVLWLYIEKNNNKHIIAEDVRINKNNELPRKLLTRTWEPPSILFFLKNQK